MNRKLVVFDFDGTLVDFIHAFSIALAEFSHARNLPHDLAKMSAGYIDPYKYDLGWGLPLDRQKPLHDALMDYILEETIANKRFIPPLFDGAKSVLEELAQSYDFAVVTARDRPTLHAIMDYHQIKNHFQAIRTLCCTRERGYNLKPAPDAIYCLLKDTKHMLDDVIMVGDTTADIDMANAAGVKSIAVAWGLHPRERLAASNPTIMLDSVNDLPAAISKLFN